MRRPILVTAMADSLEFDSPADFAHAINNPIGAILLAAQGAKRFLDQDSSPERLREALELIEEEAKRCGQIVRTALAERR